MKNGKFEVGDFITPRVCKEPKPVAMVTEVNLYTDEINLRTVDGWVIGMELTCPNDCNLYEIAQDGVEPASESELINMLMAV